MTKSLQWGGVVLGIILVSLGFVQTVSAQTPCGYFITTEDGETYQEPIDDCNNPLVH